jgi:secreted trypsin-like serine protease
VGSLLPTQNEHKIKSITDCIPAASLIVGGEAAKTGEFPHMAAVGWNYNGRLDFACGGSLISDRFVLTAAHCLRRDNQPPNVIRLGEQHLYSDLDGAQPQEFGVKRTIKHGNYSIRYNYFDIALIELDRPVRFNKFIRPACLWQSYNVDSDNATATGWGLLEFAGSQSEDLQKVSLSLMQNRDCQSYFTNLSKFMKKSLYNGIVNSQICAAAIEGGRLVAGKDTCQGDSGGPLQITLQDNPCVYYVVGLTSFSFPGCANANSPGVYTRVSGYIDWIESQVWPEYNRF